MAVAAPDIRHQADEQTLVDSQGQAWLWVLPLHSWVHDTGAGWLLRDRAGIAAEFGLPEPGHEAVDECDGADRPGWIEPGEPVHHRGDPATQVMPAVSPESCPPVRTSATQAGSDAQVQRSA